MLDSLNTKYPFNDNLKINLSSIAGISIGIFLFLLFFQPVIPKNPDFNNKLLILAGFGSITFVLLGILRILLPSFLPKLFNSEKWTYKKELLLNLLFLIFNTLAFVFFARYVGKIEIAFFNTIQIILISICSTVVLISINGYWFFKMKIAELSESIDINEEEFDGDASVEIEFESENKSEYFHLFPEQIILIKSANNYIEIIYKNKEKISRRLIRNTLKNTEKMLSKYPSMIRCHRSCIVNKNFIQKMTKGRDGLKLILFDYPQEIFVSRQYSLTVKNALKLL